MDIPAIIAHQGLFASLSPAQVKAACRDAKWLNLKRGQPLFTQGEAATSFYYLAEGQIKLILLSPTGEEKILDIIQPGAFIAEASMFSPDLPYPVGANCLKPCRLVQFSCGRFLGVLQHANGACLSLLHHMSQRLSCLIHEVYALTLTDASCRVAAYLLDQANRNGAHFDLDVPKIVLASRLSVKPETLSRIIKQFSSSQLISIDKTRIQVLDPNSLKSLTESCTRLEACRLHALPLRR